jgi:predicted dehydrogenase
MIVAKCSHDADLLCWLSGSEARSVSSYGRLDWFHAGMAPAGAPPRCTDGCPVAAQCMFDAHRYLTDRSSWLGLVMDVTADTSEEQKLDFLRTSPWGRCVYHCDNDAVDHQIVAVEMGNGITATLTMTAFDEGRTLEIHGTDGSLRGGMPYHEAGTPELWLRDHRSGTVESIPLPTAEGNEGYASHGGGDFGLIDALDGLFASSSVLRAGLDGLAGHRLAFLAEESRHIALL